MELDHIVPREEGGPDEIENAIPVCFECHAEIHSYNIKHPRGRRFRPDELRQHKAQWLRICEERPEAFIEAARDSDVGPLQALIDELEFNKAISTVHQVYDIGSLMYEHQFMRAIREGAISLLQDDLKASILEAYRLIGSYNQTIVAITHARGGFRSPEAINKAQKRVIEADPAVQKAHAELLSFLSSETPDNGSPQQEA